MIKHYIFFLFVSCALLEAKTIPIYEDCDEYYDSRGFYHNSCNKKTLTQRDVLKAIEQYTGIIQPGSGAEEEKNDKPINTPTPTTTEALPEELDLKIKEENEKALKEDSDFEFGKEQ